MIHLLRGKVNEFWVFVGILLTVIKEYDIINKHAGVAELADAQDLGSCVNSCRFDPCHPHP